MNKDPWKGHDVNATLLAQTAYRAQARTIRTTRGLEYDTMARVTHGLKSAIKDKTAGSTRQLATALHDNRRLWTILAADAADRDNPLPAELRARIVYLAEFTHQHSSKVLRDGADITPLIDINIAVMRGLSGTGHQS
ncbi:MAG: flagellar biosynthesis regulator FlaF [Roseovarius sp.]|jgi:flagellar protein FlaF|uniref:flagellar biosynthesis regulator FlaF n=1 Tax=Roseovarius sp. TaxID=1486281 RepID=UPI0032EAC823